MSDVVHGAPNLYFLFASMSLFNLRQGSEMVYIIPRSWTSGAYFRAFRKYLLSEGKLRRIHLFVSRSKVFDAEQVLQETMIIMVAKEARCPESALITSGGSGNDFSNISSLEVPYHAVVSGNELYVCLPASQAEMEVIRKISTFSSTMPDSGLRMKTGIVVDFRQADELRTAPGEHTIPLFYSQHIRDGKVNHLPSGKGYDWILDRKRGLIQKNKNYVFVKRFTAKEERRRLQCGIYCPHDFGQYEWKFYTSVTTPSAFSCPSVLIILSPPLLKFLIPPESGPGQVLVDRLALAGKNAEISQYLIEKTSGV